MFSEETVLDSKARVFAWDGKKICRSHLVVMKRFKFDYVC